MNYLRPLIWQNVTNVYDLSFIVYDMSGCQRDIEMVRYRSIDRIANGSHFGGGGRRKHFTVAAEFHSNDENGTCTLHKAPTEAKLIFSTNWFDFGRRKSGLHNKISSLENRSQVVAASMRHNVFGVSV